LSHPTFFAISLDYLPIQASAVPSKRAFSSSAKTDMKKHNHINLVLMEALQMLKFALKKSCLNFTEGWITVESEMQDQEPDEDLLAMLLRDNHEDMLDKIISAFAEDGSDNEMDNDDDNEENPTL
jgi:hypothetical protein